MLPIADGKVNRRKRAPRCNRRCKDGPGRKFTYYGQIGPQTQNRRLQNHPQHPRYGAKSAADVIRAGVQFQMVFVGGVKAPDSPPGKSHCLQHIRIARVGICHHVAGDRGLVGGRT